jgi:hypothetical protein
VGDHAHLAEARHRWPHLNRREAEKAGHILRRLAYLRDLMATNMANNWDMAEVAALEWVLEFIDRDLQSRAAVPVER